MTCCVLVCLCWSVQTFCYLCRRPLQPLAVTQLLPPVISCNIVHLQPLAVPHASRASPPASPLNAAVGVGASSNVPSEWICPLSNKLMTDPVTGMCFICPYILVSFVILAFWSYYHLAPLKAFCGAFDCCLQHLTVSTTSAARFATGSRKATRRLQPAHVSQTRGGSSERAPRHLRSQTNYFFLKTVTWIMKLSKNRSDSSSAGRRAHLRWMRDMRSRV